MKHKTFGHGEGEVALVVSSEDSIGDKNIANQPLGDDIVSQDNVGYREDAIHEEEKREFIENVPTLDNVGYEVGVADDGEVYPEFEGPDQVGQMETNIEEVDLENEGEAKMKGVEVEKKEVRTESKLLSSFVISYLQKSYRQGKSNPYSRFPTLGMLRRKLRPNVQPYILI